MKNAEITRLFIQIVRIQQAIRTPNSKRPPAKRVALNSPRSGGFKVGTSVLTSLGSSNHWQSQWFEDPSKRTHLKGAPSAVFRKIIIGVHGLRNKPPKRLLKVWWKQSIRDGLDIIGTPHWFFRFDMAYWAHILHPEPLDPRQHDLQHPRCINAPYSKVGQADKQQINPLRKKILDVLEKQFDKLLLDENAVIRFSGLTDIIIRRYFEDLDAYYQRLIPDPDGVQRPAGEAIRQQLERLLRKHRRKRICLVAHSMGSIIAYDTLIRLADDVTIDTFITMGSPLGIPVISRKIIADLGLSSGRATLQTPESIEKKWVNVSDLADKIAFNYNLADDFKANTRGVKPVDQQVVNQYVWQGESNPHKSYGYLQTPQVAAAIHNFLKGR